MAATRANVLIVDDEAVIRDLLSDALQELGYACTAVGDARTALAALGERDFDVMLADIMMPGVSGIELLRAVRSDYPGIPIVMVTALGKVDVAVQAMREGAVDYLVKPCRLGELEKSVERALAQRHELLRTRWQQLQEAAAGPERHAEGGPLEALVKALDVRHAGDGMHSRRVLAYVRRIAAQLGIELSSPLAHAISQASLLHDVGKIGIPDSILTKPGPLSSEEWAKMREHPTIGHEMLAELGFPPNITDIVYHHHERFDGSGYPQGIAGPRIPLGARIFAVADAFDAIVTDRPYRRRRPPEEARREIEHCAGTQFDPQVVAALCAIYEELTALLKGSQAPR